MTVDDVQHMEDSIGGCVICAQNLCIDNFSSLPCGHTFHYKCILRWLCTYQVMHSAECTKQFDIRMLMIHICSEQCPTCRAHTSPANIVKRLYFAKCGDKAMNDVENSTDATVADHNNEFFPTVNENVLLSRTSEDFYGNYDGSDENYNNTDDYDNDSEDDGEHEWTMGIIGADGDSGNSDNSSVIASEGSESAAESEADNQESEEEPEYHGIISDTGCKNMASAFDASLSDTSSASLRSLSELCSEIDAASISSLNHDSMETYDSFDDCEELDGDGDTYSNLGNVKIIALEI
ncbi:zinc finger, C3HC4 type [Onchocerca flexuosa]|uniref:Zinc finger, C3HC4 type n=1 Tax=Onchocerca flexuosa TaxID=387005 RepID=A0A238BW71_9BILA|nr:zinc finger, C3HC4 type [Onchocerca flexuosa]